MATKMLEARVERLECKIHEIEARLETQKEKTDSKKRGWRWFVGIDANNPHFEEAVRLGQEWRYADRPREEDEQE